MCSDGLSERGPGSADRTFAIIPSAPQESGSHVGPMPPSFPHALLPSSDMLASFHGSGPLSPRRSSVVPRSSWHCFSCALWLP